MVNIELSSLQLIRFLLLDHLICITVSLNICILSNNFRLPESELELPFCDSDDENEIFIGPITDKEQRKCNKYNRQTVLFAGDFRKDHHLMR